MDGSIKVIAEQDVIEFLNTDDLLGKISVEPIDQIINTDQIVAALEHVDLLFIIADEENIKPIAAVAEKVRMERFCERLEPQYQNVDVKLLELRYPRPFVVFIPTETFVESEWADVTIKVKPEDMEALDEQLAKTKQLYSKIYCTEADDIRRHIEEQIPTDCQWDCIYSYGDGTPKIILYMSEYERTSEPRWGE